MPYVNIKITPEGVTPEHKAALIAGVTRLLVEVLGKNPQTTAVVIDEIETGNWGIAEETVTARRRHGGQIPGDGMSKKHAFVIYSGQSESGRVFHALTYAKQAGARGDEVEVYFSAEGTYWSGVLADPAHSMHSLFDEVRRAGLIEGACHNCANAFGNADSAEEACGLVHGAEASYGQIDVLGLEDMGWRVWLF